MNPLERQLFSMPSGHLTRYISSIALYTFKTDQAIQFVPEGCIELIFQLKGKFKHRLSTNNQWQYRPDYFIGGLHNKSYFVKSSTVDSYCIGIKLTPHFAKQLFQNLHQYKNQIVCFSNLWSSARQRDLQQLIQTGTINCIASNLTSYFQSLIDESSTYNHLIHTQCIDENNGRISVSKLATAACLSESHYRKLFREQIGLSPREYCKVIRIKHAVKLIQERKFNHLTELAHSLGYFDQSHFIREFKSILNVSPRLFISGSIKASDETYLIA